jgi:excinuclease ABC subunit C
MDDGESGKTERLRTVAREAPMESGVYLMKDADGRIIYIGKAKALRNRLSSYFTGAKEIKTRHLVSRIDQIEYIVTKDEYEALLLENTLIKQHSPRYNISLKDGKTYPVIKVTGEEFPRVYRTRRVVADG